MTILIVFDLSLSIDGSQRIKKCTSDELVFELFNLIIINLLYIYINMLIKLLIIISIAAYLNKCWVFIYKTQYYNINK